MSFIKTGDQNLVKQINKSIVLDCIEQRGPISRADISKITNLNKATVSSMVSDLIQEHLVLEIGMGKSSGGRKPVMLRFNDHAGFSIGIDLGVNYILAILTDLKGTIVEEISEPLQEKNAEHIVNQLFRIIEQLIESAPESPYGVIGIGIGVPGAVNTEGKVLFTPNIDLNDFDLKQRVESRFQIHTIVVNEANAGVFGELQYGAGKGIHHLIYVSLGIGIGTGIIVGEELYTGATGISGELGHHTIEISGEKCSCGNYGCWEQYASESAMIKEACKLEVFKYSQNVNLGMIEIEANKENEEVILLLERIGYYIGVGLSNIIHTFNPEMVILGNRLVLFKKWLKEPIQKTIRNRISKYHQDAVQVKFADLGKYSSALGATSFVIAHFLDAMRITVK